MLDELLDWSLLGYTRIGYRLRRRSDWSDFPDLSSRTLVITGATGGLGEATAIMLAEHGARLVLVGRDPRKLDAVSDRARASGAQAVQTECADLSLMRDVRRLGLKLRAAGDADVLVNNVGVLLNTRSETPEGFETTFATNLLGHYLLTELLWPMLSARVDARVVNVSSGGMYAQRLEPDDLETRQRAYEGPAVYARTKRGQVVLTDLWGRRHPEVGVYALHPGWADTEGVRVALPAFRRVTSRVLRDAREGADTTVWLAGGKVPPGLSGRFFHDRQVRPVHRLRATRECPEDADRLEAELEKRLVQLFGEDWRNDGGDRNG